MIRQAKGKSNEPVIVAWLDQAAALGSSLRRRCGLLAFATSALFGKNRMRYVLIDSGWECGATGG